MTDNLHHLRKPERPHNEMDELRQAINTLIDEILAIRNEIAKLTKRK